MGGVPPTRGPSACPEGRTARSRTVDPHPGDGEEGKRRARAISAARLRRSHALHLRPINQVVYLGPYRKEN